MTIFIWILVVVFVWLTSGFTALLLSTYLEGVSPYKDEALFMLVSGPFSLGVMLIHTANRLWGKVIYPPIEKFLDHLIP